MAPIGPPFIEIIQLLFQIQAIVPEKAYIAPLTRIDVFDEIVENRTVFLPGQGSEQSGQSKGNGIVLGYVQYPGVNLAQHPFEFPVDIRLVPDRHL